MEATDALTLILTRNVFYKTRYYLSLAALWLCFVVTGFLGWVLLYLYRSPQHPLYFPTNAIGQLIQVIPVTEPNMTTQEVMDWAVQAVTQAFSLDFVNYRAELQGAQKYYTQYGWNNFIKGLEDSGNLLALTQRNLIYTAQVIEQPTLLAAGILAGKYAWKLQMPVLMSFMPPPYSDSSRVSNPWLVTLIVQRQEILQSNHGLGIVQTIVGSYGGNNNQQPISTSPTGPGQ